jgi:hypothetical protein
MEYRGKTFTAVQDIEGKWKWSVDLDGHTRTAKALDRSAAIKMAQREIDRHLAPKKVRLRPPVR